MPRISCSITRATRPTCSNSTWRCAATAAALAKFNAIVTLNETAHTSVPAPALLPHEEDGGDTLHAMRTLPLLFLYAGMVVIEPEGENGIWVRTFGCPAFSLPDLVIRPGPDDRGPEVFNLLQQHPGPHERTGTDLLAGRCRASWRGALASRPRTGCP